ncbi:hypothetical protein PUN28_018136 [Cardiocondyla obscurior]|uniref:Uncharacterized protein n=1 Tax=Cardiocondyla obscurior TaxID=286306 RepID=A0AAW2EFZ1_9HYME
MEVHVTEQIFRRLYVHTYHVRNRDTIRYKVYLIKCYWHNSFDREKCSAIFGIAPLPFPQLDSSRSDTCWRKSSVTPGEGMSYRIGPRGRRIFLSEKLKMPNIIYIYRSKITRRRAYHRGLMARRVARVFHEHLSRRRVSCRRQRGGYPGVYMRREYLDL